MVSNPSFAEPMFVSECEIDSDFSDFNYKPATDGLFTVKLDNPEQIPVDKIHKLKVEFAGSYIPRNIEDMEWIEQ